MATTTNRADLIETLRVEAEKYCRELKNSEAYVEAFDALEAVAGWEFTSRIVRRIYEEVRAKKGANDGYNR